MLNPPPPPVSGTARIREILIVKHIQSLTLIEVLHRPECTVSSILLKIHYIDPLNTIHTNREFKHPAHPHNQHTTDNRGKPVSRRAPASRSLAGKSMQRFNPPNPKRSAIPEPAVRTKFLPRITWIKHTEASHNPWQRFDQIN